MFCLHRSTEKINQNKAFDWHLRKQHGTEAQLNYQQFSSRCVNIARMCFPLNVYFSRCANRIFPILMSFVVLNARTNVVDLICNSSERFCRLNFAVIVHGTIDDDSNKWELMSRRQRIDECWRWKWRGGEITLNWFSFEP